MEKRLLIVGLDPGTTTAYAILDMYGNFIEASSSKDFGLSQLLQKIVTHGRAVIVATDKHKTPAFVESFAAKVGAKIMSPRRDLKIAEKREMIAWFSAYPADAHQEDALAAAAHALRRINPLLQKIDYAVTEEQKPQLRAEVIEQVFRHNQSIAHAVELLLRPPLQKSVPDDNAPSNHAAAINTDKLQQRLHMLQKDNAYLRKHIESLRYGLARRERELAIHKSRAMRPLAEKFSHRLNNKEKTLKVYEYQCSQKDKIIRTIKQELGRLTGILMAKDAYYVLKKLDTLGSAGFEARKMLLNIGKEDIILVDNPAIVSKNVVQELAHLVSIIVHIKPISRKMRQLLPFTFIPAQELAYEDLGTIAVIGKEDLEAAKKNYHALANIIKTYQQERELLH